MPAGYVVGYQRPFHSRLVRLVYAAAVVATRYLESAGGKEENWEFVVAIAFHLRSCL